MYKHFKVCTTSAQKLKQHENEGIQDYVTHCV